MTDLYVFVSITDSWHTHYYRDLIMFLMIYDFSLLFNKSYDLCLKEFISNARDTVFEWSVIGENR